MIMIIIINRNKNYHPNMPCVKASCYFRFIIIIIRCYYGDGDDGQLIVTKAKPSHYHSFIHSFIQSLIDFFK